MNDNVKDIAPVSDVPVDWLSVAVNVIVKSPAIDVVSRVMRKVIVLVPPLFALAV